MIEEARELIKNAEGLSLKAYRCPAGVLTIGYGSTGPEVIEGLRITEEQAEDLLDKDIEKFEKGVLKLVKVPLNPNQLGALVSFAFNLGLGALGKSTLLRLLNEGNYKAAANQFVFWVHAGGKVLPGLVTRRKAEAALFRKPIDNSSV